MNAWTPAQVADMHIAFVSVALLMGKADGNMDEIEEEIAAKVIEARSYDAPEPFRAFYKDLSLQWSTLFQQHQSSNSEQLQHQIINGANLLDALEPVPAYALDQDLRTLANYIARSSGGILGLGTVNKKENTHYGLPWLKSRVKPEGYDNIELLEQSRKDKDWSDESEGNQEEQ